MGVMNVHTPTAAYRALIFVLRMLLELAPCPMLQKITLNDRPKKCNLAFERLSNSELKISTVRNH